MKKIYILSILFLTAPLLHADETSDPARTDPLELCLITGAPPTDISFVKIQNIKVGKGSYGSVTDILPVFASKANSLGANGVVNYVGSQRFGFWPWRLVRPVVRGEAVKIELPADKTCKDIGGATVREVIATNKEPHKIQG